MAADRVTVLFGLDGASMHKPEWTTLRGSALRVTFGADDGTSGKCIEAAIRRTPP